MKTSYIVASLLAVALAAVILAVPEAQHVVLAFLANPYAATGVMLAHAVPSAVVSSKHMRSLQQKKAEKVAKMREISSAAGENQFTPEQKEHYEKLRAERDALDEAITREADLVASEAQLGVATLPDGAVTVAENAANDPKGGFKSLGEFARATMAHPGFQGQGFAMGGKLVIGAAAPTTYGNELSGVDGGFLVPPQFSQDIFQLSLGEDSFVPYTDNVDVQGNSMVFPKDETTPWGTDGIRAYWQGEAGAGTQTKPKLGTLSLRLHKLLALVPLSDELMADANALTSYLPAKVAASIRWKTNDAIINGTGAGQPQGIAKSGAAVTVSKDAAQAANTLTINNLANMMAQLPPGSYSTAVWLIHNTVLGALFTLNSSGFPYYLPFGSGRGPLADSPFGALLGRPVIISQHAGAFSALGDVQLVDFRYYQTISKGGMQTATSMHLYFDADATAFRTTYRIDGKSKIAAAITQNAGTPKLSPFLLLQAR